VEKKKSSQPSRKLLWPALLLGPHVRVRAGVLLEDLEVGVVLRAPSQHGPNAPKRQNIRKGETNQLLATKGADRLWLGGFDGGSVCVDGDAGAGRVGLFLLAVDAVFLCDGHVGVWGFESRRRFGGCGVDWERRIV